MKKNIPANYYYTGEPPLFAHSRRTDPFSSRAAGDRHAAAAKTNRQKIIESLAGKPPMTSKQIALPAGLERHEAARRLSELAKSGQVHVRVFEGSARENEYWIG